MCDRKKKASDILGGSSEKSALVHTQQALTRCTTELSLAAARLEQKQQIRNELVSSVSHELRAQLVTAMGHLKLLVDGGCGPLPEDALRYMSVALKNLRRLSFLLDSMPEPQTMKHQDCAEKVVCKPFDLALMAREEFARFLLRNSNTHKQASLDLPAQPLRTLGDEGQLRRVLANLLDYAMCQAQHQVRLAGTQCADTVKLAVINDGPEHQDSGAGLLSESDGGAEENSLSLARIKKILEAHCASLSITREPGGGTCFAFQLAAWPER